MNVVINYPYETKEEIDKLKEKQAEILAKILIDELLTNEQFAEDMVNQCKLSTR